MANESATTATDEQADLFQRFQNFLKSFRTEYGSLKYREVIQRLPVTGERSVIIDYNELLDFDPQLARQAIDDPEDCIKSASEAVKTIVGIEDRDYVTKITEDGYEFKARLRNVTTGKIKLRMIRAHHIGKLIMVDGIITRVSEVKPQLLVATFECNCGQKIFTEQFEGRYTAPPACPACKREGPFNLIVEESKFIDWQKIRIQEMPEELPPGQMPRSTDAIIKDDLVDIARPGDRVAIIGTLMSVQDFAPKRGRLTTFRTYIDSNYVDTVDKESEKVEITPEEERFIIDLAKDEWIHQKITKSIAPSIYGLEDVKEAIALTLFGGVPKTLPDGVKIRGEINVLLVGDPGTAKSVHGAERIYVGRQTSRGTDWKRQPIGHLIDDLMARNPQRVVSQGDTEILTLNREEKFLTQAMDPVTLKTRQSNVLEVSRHQAERLIHIRTRSGRSVIATPDHSFTTIDDGRLRALAAKDLKLRTYLPVARRIELDEAPSYIDLAQEFPRDNLVCSEMINTQVALVDAGETSGRLAASASNISANTFSGIVRGHISIPDGFWLRLTDDTSWFPRFLDLAPALGRIFGLYLADGNVEVNAVRVTALNRSIKRVLKKDFEEVFGKASTAGQAVLLCQASIASWFKQTFGTGAQAKQTPSFLLTAPYSFRCSLLSAYFSGDGTVDQRGSAVTATTRSIGLARQLSDLLATIGIFATIKRRVMRKGRYRGRIYWMLRIQGTDVLEYGKHIGFVSPAKARSLKRLVARLASRRRYQSRDIIPNYGALLKDVTKELAIQGKRGYWTRNFLAELRGKTQRQRMGKEYMRKVASRLSQLKPANQQSPCLDWLTALAESDIFWDPITEIQYSQQPTTVYDIGTSDGHFILAEGNLVTHNSQLLMYTAGLAPRGLYTSGKGSSAAGLCVAGSSMVALGEGLRPISEIVQQQFGNHGFVEHTDGVQFSECTNSSLNAYHSRNLKMELGPIERVWRIRSPENLIRIRTVTGKEVLLTPQTSILSIVEEVGLVWKQAAGLASGDRIATARKLAVTGLKKPPSVFQLIKNYPSTVFVLGLKKEVADLVSRILRKESLTKRRLAEILGVTEDTVHRWTGKRAVRSVSLKNLIALCDLIGEDFESHLTERITVETEHGKKITLPRRVDTELFYIMGLIAGDGRISIDRRADGYGGTTIGLSNRQPKMIDRFSRFFNALGLTVNYTEGSKDRAPEVRVYSSLLAHILSCFGLSASPKSTMIAPNTDMIFYPDEYLGGFVKGLFDAEGWFYQRKTGKEGGPQVGISSTSNSLVNFVQNALLTKGIVSFAHKREPSIGVSESGKIIAGREQRYEVLISNHSDILLFARHFCFEDPSKRRRLVAYCSASKRHHKNIDNIPNIASTIWQLMQFYNAENFRINGKMVRFAPTRFSSSMSFETLSQILEQLELNWHKHRVRVPLAQRNQLYRELHDFLSSEEISRVCGLTHAQLYEYFQRKRSIPAIPIRIIVDIIEASEGRLAKQTKEYWTKLISAIRSEHSAHLEKCELLRGLCQSDIFWDRVDQVQQCQAQDPYVYDLTIPKTHNFLVNGFVVHNTAAVLRDADTGDMTLEAGALVLADRGVACLHPSTNVIFDNRIVTIESLFDENLITEATSGSELVQVSPAKGKVKAFDINDLDSVDDDCTLVRRKMYNGRLIRMRLASGFEVRLTPDHKLVDGDSLRWKDAGCFRTGEAIIAPLRLSDTTTPIYIFDIIPDDWMVVLKRENKNVLRKRILQLFRNLSEFNRHFEVTRHILSGRQQFRMGKLKEILECLGLVSEWKERTLGYGRKCRSETLRINQVTPELAYLIGFVYGDGDHAISKRRSRFSISQSVKKKDIIENLDNALHSISDFGFNRYCRTTRSNIRGKPVISKNVTLYKGSNLLVFLIDYFLRDDLRNVLRLPQECIKAFISGALDADGCASIKNGAKGDKVYQTAHVEFLLSNNREKDLAFILALRRLDVYARLRRRKSINVIRITGRKDVQLLCDLTKRYSIKARNATIPDNAHKVSCASEKLPSQAVSQICNVLSQENKKSELLDKGIWSTIHAYMNEKYQPSREQLLKIASLMGDNLPPAIVDEVNRLLKRDYFLDRIVSIKEEHFHGWVYDLFVKPHHDFVGNGVIMHNCVDEFDKMNPQDRVAIHQAMEQQTISIAKAGIVATLNARTAILAAANPALGRYNSFKNPAENITLPVTVLSRFDLIFVMVDKPESERDKKMAEHIVSLHSLKATGAEAPITPQLLRKYISYAKRSMPPTLTAEAAKKIQEFYLETRAMGENPESPVPITARQLEALVRLSEARAKMALKKEITVDDAEAVIRLMTTSLKMVGIDRETMRADIDTIMVGKTKSQRERFDLIITLVRELGEGSKEGFVQIDRIVEAAAVQGVEKQFAMDAINKLIKEGVLFEPRQGIVKKA